MRTYLNPPGVLIQEAPFWQPMSVPAYLIVTTVLAIAMNAYIPEYPGCIDTGGPILTAHVSTSIPDSYYSIGYAMNAYIPESPGCIDTRGPILTAHVSTSIPDSYYSIGYAMNAYIPESPGCIDTRGPILTAHVSTSIPSTLVHITITVGTLKYRNIRAL